MIRWAVFSTLTVHGYKKIGSVMDPITGSLAVAAGSQAVSALVNAYNAEKARGADRKRLSEIRALFEKIKPPDYDVSIDSPPQYHEQVLAQPRYSDPMQAPKFDTSKLQPEDLKLVGKYTPEIAPYIAESNPQLVQRSSEAMQGRGAMQKALERYMQMGETGDDAISAQDTFNARLQAGQDTRSRQKAIEQSFARRGQLGSGMQFAGELQSAQAAGNQQALAQMQAAADAQRRRLGALASGAQLGGQIYGQEMDLAAQNTAIINDFNRRMASGRQAYENQRVGAMNAAQQFNLGMEQDIANANVNARNRAQEQNLRRSDDITRYQGDWQRGERNRMDDIERQRYGMARDERAFQNDIAQRKADWAANQRKIRNSIAGQQFDDQYRWASGMQGVLGMQRDAARQRDIDRATQMQGAANVASSTAEGYGNQSRWASEQAAKDERAGIVGPEGRKQRKKDYMWGDY
jgi:hypothetical protein